MEYIEIRVFDRDEQCAITEHVQRTGSVGDFIKRPSGLNTSRLNPTFTRGAIHLQSLQDSPQSRYNLFSYEYRK